MKCTACKHGETKKGKVTVTLERNEAIIIFKDVPAMVCQVCASYYLDSATTEMLLKKAEEAVRNGSELEIIKLKAA